MCIEKLHAALKFVKFVKLFNVFELRGKKSSFKVLRVLLLIEGVLQKYVMTSLFCSGDFCEE